MHEALLKYSLSEKYVQTSLTQKEHVKRNSKGNSMQIFTSPEKGQSCLAKFNKKQTITRFLFKPTNCKVIIANQSQWIFCFVLAPSSLLHCCVGDLRR